MIEDVAEDEAEEVQMLGDKVKKVKVLDMVVKMAKMVNILLVREEVKGEVEAEVWVMA